MGRPVKIPAQITSQTSYGWLQIQSPAQSAKHQSTKVMVVIIWRVVFVHMNGAGFVVMSGLSTAKRLEDFIRAIDLEVMMSLLKTHWSQIYPIKKLLVL